MWRTHLVWAVLWLVALAGAAVVYDWFLRHRESTRLVGRALLHQVELGAAGIVLIETPGGQVTLRRTAWGWEVEEQGGFAADTAKLRALLLTLGSARIAQRVPVARDRLGDLGLLQKSENEWRFEPGRTATVFSIVHGVDRRHRLMYQVLLGNPRPGGGTYVRFPEARIVYLVAEELALSGDARDWIRHRVFDEDAPAAMQRIRIRRDGRPALTLARAGADAPWQPAAPHGPLLSPEHAHALVRTLAELRIADLGAPSAAPARTDSTAPQVLIEVRFFDRRAVTLALRAAQPPDGHRPALLAAGLEGDDAGERARWHVEVFNRHYGGRVVKLDAEQSRRLTDTHGVGAAAR